MAVESLSLFQYHLERDRNQFHTGCIEFYFWWDLLLHVSLLFVLLLNYLFYPNTTFHSVYHRLCLWNIQCLKDQELQQRKWNLHNVLSGFFQPFNGMHIIIFSKCPKLFMTFDKGIEFSLSIHPITKSFKGFDHWFVRWRPGCNFTLSLTWNIFLCQKNWFTLLVTNNVVSHQIYA